MSAQGRVAQPRAESIGIAEPGIPVAYMEKPSLSVTTRREILCRLD
jgi:hypothetical protein